MILKVPSNLKLRRVSNRQRSSPPPSGETLAALPSKPRDCTLLLSRAPQCVNAPRTAAAMWGEGLETSLQSTTERKAELSSSLRLRARSRSHSTQR